MQGRHTEFFGPDFARGPFAPHKIETAAVQIATAIAQVRAPLTRSDDDLLSHASFIRELADRIAPDWAAQVSMYVGDEVSSNISTSIRIATGTYSLLDCWLADASGGGVTATIPDAITFTSGTVLETILAKKRYLVIAPPTGVVNTTVTYTGTHAWRWAVSRHARVYYSAELDFS